MLTAVIASPTNAAQLLQFNCELIEQAEAIVVAYTARVPSSYPAVLGPQVRHVIEHYEAITSGPIGGRIDYDRRKRDRRLENDPVAAVARLRSIGHELESWNDCVLAQPLTLCARAGMAGELQVELPTSVGRELLFLASHTVHHFALLADHLRSVGISVHADFGKAPATIAYERSRPQPRDGTGLRLPPLLEDVS